ncbi:hypothetical protein RA27_19395 [Ruegeria sp. ANG-R]|uniref:AAA family ATPase n=1 Tax=Ruegeria sp. ANG-R TaxID=1577903 RepID=UPI00057DF866|nr:adenylate/guanylate cyclase domain-containing protein [Ruegeria sp. ANG-R]KIC38593.1 hypothetical protein RA27_19395 [Ruegeria sp. ANG-R]
MAGIRTWLESISLEKYYDAFAANSIDLDLVATLTENDLIELGLNLGDRKRMMLAIEDLHTHQYANSGGEFDRTAKPDILRAIRPGTSDHIPERRYLTLVFIDLVGSTWLSSQLDLEEYRAVLHDYQALCFEIIRGHQGHIAQFIGDGVVAYFGYPTVEENDAERAVAAGLEICGSIEKIKHGDGQTIGVRVGVSSGEAVVDGHSTLGGLVFGEVPNLAARVQELADPGTVAISEHTKLLIGKNFVCEWKGKQELKGFEKPVGIWQVLSSEVPELRFRARQRTADAPFVNRVDEIETIMKHWRAARRGNGQAVMLCGEAGIGKSRLVEAATRGFGTRQCLQLSFQCSPNHERSAHFPVVSCISHMADFRRSDSVDQKLKKLRQLFAEWSEVSEKNLPLFANAMSLPIAGDDELPRLPSDRLKTQFQDAMVQTVVELSRRRPVLLLFEDLHWIDPSTEEIVELLIERLRSRPVLIVCTFRPTYRPPWTDKSGVVSLQISRLDRDHVHQMLDELLQSEQVTQEMKDQIATRTDGVPLFAEEMARMVDNRFAEPGDPSTHQNKLALPSTLKELFWAMIDKLDSAREIVPICAAIGRNILPAMVSTVSNHSIEATLSMLDELVEAHILVRRGVRSEGTYSFRHALIREAAYDLMLPSRARAVHSRIADVMATSFSDLVGQNPELLAQHYGRADLPRQARDAWRQAAVVSNDRFANEETIHHLNKALSENAKIEPNPDGDQQEIALRKMLNVALSTRAFGSKEVLENLDRFRHLLDRSAASSEDAFLAVHVQFGAQLTLGDPLGARVLCDYLDEVAQRAESSTMAALAAHNTGMSNFMLGNLDTAIAAFDRAIALREQAGSDDLFNYHEADIHFVDLAMRCWAKALKVGESDELRDEIAKLSALIGNESHDFTRCYGLNILATAYQVLDDTEALLELVNCAIEISQEREFHYWAAWGRILRGWAQASDGHHADGIDEISAGIEDYLQTGSTQIVLYAQTLLADAHFLAGEISEGLKVIEHVRSGEKSWSVRYQRRFTDHVETKLLGARPEDTLK